MQNAECGVEKRKWRKRFLWTSGLAVITTALVAIVAFSSSDDAFGIRLNHIIRTSGFEKTGQADYYKQGGQAPFVSERFWGSPITVEASDSVAREILDNCRGCTMEQGRSPGDWTITVPTARDMVIRIAMYAQVGKNELYTGQPAGAFVDVRSTNYRHDGVWDKILITIGQ